MITIYTIGHSNHTVDTFLSLLQRHRIQAVADVRSSPYSRFSPQFNRDVLPKCLRAINIEYAFMGDRLGARPHEPACYQDGSVDFASLSRTDTFKDGLIEARNRAVRVNLALLCSEKDPIHCHRMILVCRHLRSTDTLIRHIRETGAVEDNHEAERRLLTLLHMEPADLFRTPDQMIEEAYDRQGARIAYHEEERVSANRGIAVSGRNL